MIQKTDPVRTAWTHSALERIHSITAPGDGRHPHALHPLDLLRAESYLLFYPFDTCETYPFEDQGPGGTLWKLGLDFTVSPDKKHYRLKGRDRFKIYGVKLDGTEPAEEGAPLLKDGRELGVVTIGMYSPLNEHNVGIARMPVDCAVEGTKLTVRNAAGEIPAVAHPMPFYDPEKKRRTARG